MPLAILESIKEKSSCHFLFLILIVPPFTKAAKEPLSYVGINSIGLRRRGFTTEKIREIQDIYRILYQKNYISYYKKK